jgi:predicted nucleic acid-binding protein
MKHVLVETNWVVGYAAPAHHQHPEARALFERAQAGELRLYLPSVCLTEARFTVPRRFQPRNEADALRKFLVWARREGKLAPGDDAIVRRVVDMFESKVRGELSELGSVLEALRHDRAIDVFPLDDEMLERAAAIGASDLDLQPFDQAILAAVLVKAEQLVAGGFSDLSFCEIDTDLQPWDRQGNAKPSLTRLYDAAPLWVYGDFLLAAPSRPATFGS